MSLQQQEISIVGGHRSSHNQHQYVLGFGGCTAFVIHPHVAMTAAHCVPKFDFRRKSGKLSVGNSVRRSRVKTMRYKKLVVDSRYKKKSMIDHAFFIFEDNLQLKFEIAYIPEIIWLNLNMTLELAEAKPTVYAIGYGYDKAKRTKFKNWVGLSFLNFYYDDIDPKTKKNTLNRWREKDHSGNGLPTAFTLSNMTKDTCDGDSGGPILMGGMYLGMTIGGDRLCGSGRTPSVYRTVATNICFFAADLKKYFPVEIATHCK